MKHLLLCVLVLMTCCIQIHFGRIFDSKDISTWLQYDIANFESDAIQRVIQKCSRDFNAYGTFVIPQFLSAEVRNWIATQLQTVEHIPRKTTRTVFQDQGDFVNFDASSPRNFMLDNSMEFVSRLHIVKYAEQTQTVSPMIALYEYAPLLRFWRAIMSTSDIYLSKDEAGSVYGFYGRRNDWFSWHFDESPFSCIYMIQKPEQGGSMRLLRMANPLKQSGESWTELGEVLRDEQAVRDRIVSMNVDEGDVYCIYGNQTLHEVTKVGGNKDRSVFVMTYGNVADFQHTDNVNSLNDWTDDSPKSKNEL